MADLISRRAVLEAILGEPTDSHYPSWYADKVKALPTAEPQKWIPCSERLPETKVEGVIEIMGNGQREIVDSTFETSDPVLVTIKTDDGYKIAIAQWEVDSPKRKYWIYDDGGFAEGVIAWQLLPSPYKAST